MRTDLLTIREADARGLTRAASLARRYCSGHVDLGAERAAPRAAASTGRAAARGRGGRRRPRRRRRSPRPAAGSVMRPTAPVAMPASRRIACRERHLVAGPERDLRVRHQPAARAVDQVDAERPQSVARARSTARGPSRPRPSRSPRCARRSGSSSGHASRTARARPRAGSRIRFSSEPPYSSSRAVRERREELVQQVAVRRVDLDDVEAGGERAARGGDEGVDASRRSRGFASARGVGVAVGEARSRSARPAASRRHRRAIAPARRATARRSRPCARRARAGCPATAPCAFDEARRSAPTPPPARRSRSRCRPG